MRRQTRRCVSSTSAIVVAAIARYLAEKIFHMGARLYEEAEARMFTPQSLGMGIQRGSGLAQIFWVWWFATSGQV